MKTTQSIVIFLFFSNLLFSQSQIGSDIDGDAGLDFFGFSVSLSTDGSRLAVGSFRSDENGEDSGYARIFEEIEGVWTQKGDDIDGEASGDQMGGAVSLSSDGDRVAIGAIFNEGNEENSGHVRVFDLSSIILPANPVFSIFMLIL